METNFWRRCNDTSICFHFQSSQFSSLFNLPVLFHFSLSPISPLVIFWPSTRPKIPFKVMHQKEGTQSNDSYERKSRGWKFANKMGQAKKSHDTLIDWCTGREWPLNSMTVISAWWRWNMRFQKSSGRSSGRELLYNSVEFESQGEFQYSWRGRGECGKESHTQPTGPSGTQMEFGEQRSCW